MNSCTNSDLKKNIQDCYKERLFKIHMTTSVISASLILNK